MNRHQKYEIIRINHREESDKSFESDIPDIDYPGNDPTNPSSEDWEWIRKVEVGSSKASWTNGAEFLHLELNHPVLAGPHWGYHNRTHKKCRISNGWLVYPNGRIKPIKQISEV